MIIDVNKLKQQGKTESDFNFTFSPERRLIDLPNAEIVGGVEVKGKVRLDGKKAFVEGKVSFVIEGECSRCLAPARAEVEAELTAEYSGEAGAEYPVRAGLIDLTEPAEEAVVINSPMIIYCREDCKGVCFGCGVNLNEGVCKCKTNREV